MSALRWSAHVLHAAVWYAINLAICTGLFLLSAHLGTQPGGDEQNGAYFFRIVASVWLFAATWSFVVRGVLRRPPQPPDTSKRKPTGAEVARGAGGCLGRLALIAALYAWVGHLADWAWAGIIGDDVRHPARRLADGALGLAADVYARPDVHAPWLLGTVVGIVVLYVLIGLAKAPRPTSGHQAKSALQTRPASTGSGRTRRRREDVAAANAAAVAAARRAGAASAAAIDAAHGGPHQRQAAAPPHAGHVFGESTGEPRDPLLGALAWSSSDNAWWARRVDAFPIRIEGARDGPTRRQLDVARAIVQRSFEVLLRGSDAARASAQARGVGLPRFTIAAAIVGAEADPSPVVTLHLRGEGSDRADYVVRSTDGLQTFKPA